MQLYDYETHLLRSVFGILWNDVIHDCIYRCQVSELVQKRHLVMHFKGKTALSMLQDFWRIKLLNFSVRFLDFGIICCN